MYDPLERPLMWTRFGVATSRFTSVFTKLHFSKIRLSGSSDAAIEGFQSEAAVLQSWIAFLLTESAGEKFESPPRTPSGSSDRGSLYLQNSPMTPTDRRPRGLPFESLRSSRVWELLYSDDRPDCEAPFLNDSLIRLQRE